MAKANAPKEQWVQVIEEYLTAAKECLNTSRPGCRMLGYPAALLLLCTTDAIGHGLLPDNGKNTRLDVLMHLPFDPSLRG
jgi:hypothetical protein